MFKLAEFSKHNFHDGLITECQNYNYFSILRGEFPEDETEISGYKYFFFQFDAVSSKLPYMGMYTEIRSFEICEKKDEKKGYTVIIYAQDDEFVSAEFDCEDIHFHRQEDRGISCRNMYGTTEYNAYVESLKYVLKEDYFSGKELYDLPDGFTLAVENYTDIRELETYTVNLATVQKCTLMRERQPVYEYLCTHNHIPFCEFIDHCNGHRYFPFHIDLYGISYLDVDTLEVYHYIPEGRQHDSDGMPGMPGESFIITDVHYDRESGLIACGGCYWAGPANVMVGDFSCLPDCGYPMEDMQRLVDPHYDQYEELDFACWNRGELLLKCGEISVPVSIAAIGKRLENKVI